MLKLMYVFSDIFRAKKAIRATQGKKVRWEIRESLDLASVPYR